MDWAIVKVCCIFTLIEPVNCIIFQSRLDILLNKFWNFILLKIRDNSPLPDLATDDLVSLPSVLCVGIYNLL